MSLKTPYTGKCPACEYPFTQADSLTGLHQTPRHGDFSLCLNCGLILIFDLYHCSPIRAASAYEIEKLRDESQEAHSILMNFHAEIRKRGRMRRRSLL